MKFIHLFLLFFSCLSIKSQMLTSMYFEYDSYVLNQDSKRKLDSLAQIKNNLKFRVFGNCDISGTSEYNKMLSEKRANTVSNYLMKKIGNNITLISSIGLGKEKQINDNSSEELRGKNRRVDIFIDRDLVSGEKIFGKEHSSFFSVKVSEMKINDIFSLPNVNFVGGRHIWFPSANKTLAQLFKILMENPTIHIELQGHICCDYDNFDGEDLDLGTFNLSLMRATAIKEFLRNLGIASERIKVSGQGHLNPVVYPERTESDRIKNRRVDLILLKK